MIFDVKTCDIGTPQNITTVTTSARTIKTVVSFFRVLGIITEVGACFRMIIGSVHPRSIFLPMMIDMLNYPVYQDVPSSEDLQYLFENKPLSPIWTDIVPKKPGFLLDNLEDQDNLAMRLNENGLYSNFIVNSWAQIVLSLAIVIGIVIFKALLYIAHKRKYAKLDAIIKEAFHITRWNLPLLMFSGFVPYTVLYSCLQFYSVPPKSFLDALSFVSGLVCLTLTAIFYYLVRHIAKIWISNKRSIVPNDGVITAEHPDFIKKWGNYHVLFTHYSDSSILKRVFLIIFLSRTALVGLLIGLLCRNQVAQTSIIASLSLVAIIYQIILKPLDKRNMIELLTYETIVLIQNISLQILSISNSNASFLRSLSENVSTFGLQKNMSYVVIASYLTFIVISLLFLMWDLLKGLKHCRSVLKDLNARQTKDVWYHLILYILKTSNVNYYHSRNSINKSLSIRATADTHHPVNNTFTCVEHGENISSVSFSLVTYNQSHILKPNNSKSISPLLRQNGDLLGSSLFNESVNNDGHSILNLKEVASEVDLETPVRRKRRYERDMSILTSSPMSFWSLPAKISKKDEPRTPEANRLYRPIAGSRIHIDSKDSSPNILEVNSPMSQFEDLSPSSETKFKIPSLKMMLFGEAPDSKELDTIHELKDVQEETERKRIQHKLQIDTIALKAILERDLKDSKESIVAVSRSISSERRTKSRNNSEEVKEESRDIKIESLVEGLSVSSEKEKKEESKMPSKVMSRSALLRRVMKNDRREAVFNLAREENANKNDDL